MRIGLLAPTGLYCAHSYPPPLHHMQEFSLHNPALIMSPPTRPLPPPPASINLLWHMLICPHQSCWAHPLPLHFTFWPCEFHPPDTQHNMLLPACGCAASFARHGLPSWAHSTPQDQLSSPIASSAGLYLVTMSRVHHLLRFASPVLDICLVTATEGPWTLCTHIQLPQ